MKLAIPPLRERTSEIAPLAERFLAEASRRLDRREPFAISPEVLAYFAQYPWPGNVRELRNVVERAAVLCTGDVLQPADLPAHVTGLRRRAGGERRRIIDALEQCAGNQTRAAKLLGISLRTLVSRLGEHDIPRPRKRS
jgi:DNA-binding NtrC family response regulator